MPLSHEQRRTRRYEMATAVSKGEDISDVARKFGCAEGTVRGAVGEFRYASEPPMTRQHHAVDLIQDRLERGDTFSSICIETGLAPQTVSNIARGLGYTGKRGRRPYSQNPSITVVLREEWNQVDWSLRDIDIAKRLGVSRERVRQVRLRLGKDKSIDHGFPDKTVRVIRWLSANREIAETVPPLELRDIAPFPVSLDSIKNALKRLGIGVKSRVKLAKRLTRETLPACVVIDPSTKCWNWTGKKYPSGYGVIGGHNYAHRAVFELFNGKVPDGLWILHKCDNPLCVNPEHLYAGTPKDNAIDRYVHGRCNGRTMTADEILELVRLRTTSAASIVELAERFGVSSVTIYKHLKTHEKAVS